MREVTAQRFGCWHGALLIVSLVATTGCLLYRGDRQPNLIGTGARATAPDAPRIEVVLHHRHTIDGKDAGGQATELTFKQMKSSWERVQKETPFLANAGSGIAKADFVLDLDTEVAEHGKVAAIVSGATLLLFPGFISSNVMEGDAQESDGRDARDARGLRPGEGHFPPPVRTDPSDRGHHRAGKGAIRRHLS